MAATILLAEANDILRHVVGRTLSERGYDVVRVQSAAEALDVLEAGAAVDCIVTDVGLPGRDIPDLMQTLRETAARIPLIYVSGYPVEAAVRRYQLRAGAPYLLKPFTEDELLATIRRAVGEPDGPGAA